MKVLVTGICGYVGSRIAQRLAETSPNVKIIGMDNLSRRGSQTNLAAIKEIDAEMRHGDLRVSADVRSLPAVDWVIDCAANPTVLAGVQTAGACNSEQLVQHNLLGTLNILEYCRVHGAGLVLLSTSRVYSIDVLNRLPLAVAATRLVLDEQSVANVPGCSSAGINEDFPTSAPISLYGATKLASETMALEYGAAFGFPVWIDRCGVIGGPGQFGRADQGIFSFWVYSCALERPLSYIGFGGVGKQVRDCVTADDVASLIVKQIDDPNRDAPRILNVGGGSQGAMSLLELTACCEQSFGRRISVAGVLENRAYDIPYYVTDTEAVRQAWGWRPTKTAEAIVSDLCRWAFDNRGFVESLFV